MTADKEKISSLRNNSLLIGLLLAAAIFTLSINTLAGNFGDTGYHIKTGEYVLQTGSVPKEDIFSYASPKNPWIAHYWLSDVIFFLVYEFGGLWGIILFPALIGAITYVIVWIASVLRGADPLLSSIATLAASYLTLEQWVARPQIFLYLFTAILILIFEHWRKSDGEKYLYIIPFIILVWTNMHASAIFGAGIFGIYLFQEIIKSGIGKNLKPIILFLASCGAMFINPNGYKVVFFSFFISDAVKQMMIAEWQSLFNSIGKTEAKIFLTQMAVMAGFILYRLTNKYFKFKKICLSDLALTLLAFAMPLASVRHVGLFALLILVPFTSELAEFLKEKRINFGNKSFLKPAIIGFLIVILFSLTNDLWKDAIDKRIMPVGAAQFIKENNITGPIFNSLDNGGYLIWSLWPEEKIFIDGRNEVYAGPVYEEYLAIFKQTQGWEGIINDKYKINTMILSYRNANWEFVSALFKTLTKSDKFKFVYWDDGAIVLLRKNNENKAIIDKFAYELIGPFTDPLEIQKELREKAVLELKRAMEISPGSEILNGYIR